MKKLITTILAFVYISTSIGGSFHMHYCMGKLANWGLGHNTSKTCSKCGMEKSEQKNTGCCKDKYTFLKNSTDQKITESSFQMIQLVAAALPVSFTEISSYRFLSVTEESPISPAPPLHHRIPIYILNCIYRI